MTGADTDGVRWGVFKYTQDHPMIAIDKVRYVGEDVAGVAAVDEETALEALDFSWTVAGGTAGQKPPQYWITT